jgi:hypothetical protein
MWNICTKLNYQQINLSLKMLKYGKLVPIKASSHAIKYIYLKIIFSKKKMVKFRINYVEIYLEMK